MKKGVTCSFFIIPCFNETQHRIFLDMQSLPLIMTPVKLHGIVKSKWGSVGDMEQNIATEISSSSINWMIGD